MQKCWFISNFSGLQAGGMTWYCMPLCKAFDTQLWVLLCHAAAGWTCPQSSRLQLTVQQTSACRSSSSAGSRGRTGARQVPGAAACQVGCNCCCDMTAAMTAALCKRYLGVVHPTYTRALWPCPVVTIKPRHRCGLHTHCYCMQVRASSALSPHSPPRTHWSCRTPTGKHWPWWRQPA